MFSFFKKVKKSYRVHKTLGIYGVDPEYASKVITGFDFHTLDSKYSEFRDATDLEYTLICLVELFTQKEKDPTSNARDIVWLAEWIELLLNDEYMIRQPILQIANEELLLEEKHEPRNINNGCSKLNSSESSENHKSPLYTSRKAYCWNCFKPLDSSTNSECNCCGWLICHKCGSCTKEKICSGSPVKKKRNSLHLSKDESIPFIRSESQLLVDANALFNSFYKRVNSGSKLTSFDIQFLNIVLQDERVGLDQIHKELIFGNLSIASIDLIKNNLREYHRDSIVAKLIHEDQIVKESYEKSNLDEFGEYDNSEETIYGTSGLEDSN